MVAQPTTVVAQPTTIIHHTTLEVQLASSPLSLSDSMTISRGMSAACFGFGVLGGGVAGSPAGSATAGRAEPAVPAEGSLGRSYLPS